MGDIKSMPALSGELSYDKVSLSGTVSAAKEYTAYTGDYEIKPLPFNAQVLPTQNRLLKEDIRITEIPYFETSNNSAGITVYIAQEV